MEHGGQDENCHQQFRVMRQASGKSQNFWLADDAGLGTIYRIVDDNGDHIVFNPGTV